MSRSVSQLVSDSIAPRLVPEIEILPWRRTQVIAIQVHPTSTRPHYLKREGIDSGAYVRVGSTNRRADADMLQELRRAARGESFDEQPMPDVSSEALDNAVAHADYAQRGAPIRISIFDDRLEDPRRRYFKAAT